MDFINPKLLIVLAFTLLCGSGALWLACFPSDRQDATKNPNMTAMFNALLVAFTTGVVTLFLLAE